jgi:hypothetical protein
MKYTGYQIFPSSRFRDKASDPVILCPFLHHLATKVGMFRIN